MLLTIQSDIRFLPQHVVKPREIDPTLLQTPTTFEKGWTFFYRSKTRRVSRPPY